LDLIVKILEHVEPVLCGIWVEVINEDSITGPDFANKITTFCCLDEDISSGSLFECVACAVAGCRFDDGDVAITFSDIA
jgi:hypothetical protein